MLRIECITRRRVPALVILGAAALASCGKAAEESKKPAAATVQNAPKEDQLATVTLSADAEKRLGLELAPVEKRNVARSRSLSGEILTPPGKSNVVSAPVAGTIMAGGATRIAPPGTNVKRGEIVMRLSPMPGASEIAGAGVRLEAARRKAARVEQLLRDGAASQRSLEEAQAELGLAQAAARAVGGGRADEAVPIVSPQDGVLSAVHVGVGQTVSGGAALFQVDAKGTLWIRVPVYSGDLREIAPGAAATVSVLGSASTETLIATPTTGPPTANADAASTDLYFVLEGNQSDLRPGQKVAVNLPLTTSQESLVVPWSAVLHDLNGGTWVYENTAPNVYARRRIEVAHVVGGFAVLTKGPAVGAKVVSVGAIEIFGTEFGTGK